MPATSSGRGAQVILEGDAQSAARGGYTNTLPGNSDYMASLVAQGLVADGSTADGSTLTGVAAPSDQLSPAQARQLPRAGSLMRTWVPNGRTWATFGANVYTICSQWGLESPYNLVRFVYSAPTAAAYTIQNAIVAPSSATGDGHSPVNAAGASDFTLFQNVYFNNAGANVAPQDQSVWGSGARQLTIIGNVGLLSQPQRYYSDWMRVRSLARTDGGTQTLLMARHLTDNTATFQCSGIANVAQWPTYAQGRTLALWQQVTLDKVTTPAVLTAPVASTFCAPDGIQYYCDIPGFSVLGVGDSLTQGYGTSTSFHGWGYLSTLALSTPERPISYWNQGWQGALSQDFWANGLVAFQGTLPDVVTIATWTPNDPLTQAAIDLGWSRAMDLADYVRKHGATPVLMGPLPWGGISTVPNDALRLQIRTRLLNAQTHGMAVLDWENVMGTGASPNRIKPTLLAADVLHPNDAGCQLMDSAVFRPVLSRILRP